MTKEDTHVFGGRVREGGALGIKKGSLSSLGRFRVSCVTNMPLGVWSYCLSVVGDGWVGILRFGGAFGGF